MVKRGMDPTRYLDFFKNGCFPPKRCKKGQGGISAGVTEYLKWLLMGIFLVLIFWLVLRKITHAFE